MATTVQSTGAVRALPRQLELARPVRHRRRADRVGRPAHGVAHHFVAADGLRNYAEVVTYLRHPVILVLEVLLLVNVTVHALLGVRAVVLDFGLSAARARQVTQGLALVGVLTIGYGLWLTWIVINSTP